MDGLMPWRTAFLRVAAGPVIGALALSACGGGADGSAQAAGEAPSARCAPAGAAAQRYVDAVNARSLDRLVAAFAPDGRVRDVSRVIRGRAAIRAWARGEVVGGRLRVLRCTPTRRGVSLLVHWAPAGSDGWRARYRFDVRGDRIALADLQYA
jgi:hypothetical protein